MGSGEKSVLNGRTSQRFLSKERERHINTYTERTHSENLKEKVNRKRERKNRERERETVEKREREGRPFSFIRVRFCPFLSV